MQRPQLYILLFLVSFRSCAQQPNYVFHHLTSKDGLASDYIQSIFQDSKGFYWIGTTSGLQKFDGFTFSEPLTIDKDLMPSPNVIETKDGTLWISNGTSLFNYNPGTKRFKHILPGGNNREMVFKVIEDSLGNIWMINYHALYKYDVFSGKLILWLELPLADRTKAASRLTSAGITNNNAGVIWMHDGTTLFKISPLKKIITRQDDMPDLSATIWADGSSYVWISFYNGSLCRYNIVNGKKDWFTMPFRIKGSETINYAVASCFAKDKVGKLWIGTLDGGLWYFDESSNKVLQLKTDNSKPESFHYSELVYTMQPDREGNIWIGSDKGINIFNPTYQSFYILSNEDLPTKGIPSSIAKKPLETSTGDILVSTYRGGWLHFDNHFKLKRGFTVILNAHSPETDKTKTSVNCFAEDKRGRIWVGYGGGFLGMYEPKTGAIKYKEVPEFQKLKISGIQCDTAGNMWFAFRSFSNNIAKWDGHLKKFKIYNDSLLIKKWDQESAILITKQGDIWVQTYGNGIYRFDPVKEKIAEIYRNDQPPYYIPAAVQEIAALNDSVIAIASFAKGFFLFNPHKKTAVPLTTDQGLPSNIAKGIATDRQGNFWIAMLSDLVKMNPVTKKITSFDEEEGLINKSFTYGFTKLRDGRLLITTQTGLVYFHPDSIKMQPPPPDALLTGLKLSGKPVLLDSILKTTNNTIQLSYDRNFITIDYVSISYLNRRTTQYFYKTEV